MPTKMLLRLNFYCCLSVSFLLLAKNSSAAEFSLLLGQEHWQYKEFDHQDKELDRETGWLRQVGVAALVDATANIKVNVHLARASGVFKYDGQTQTGIPHQTHTDTHSTFYALTGRYYWDTPQHFTQQLYAGFGLQHQKWSRKIRAAGKVRHLNEYYRWTGPRLEGGAVFLPHQPWRLELGLAAAWLNGDMAVDLTDMPSRADAYGRPVVKLRNGYEISGTAQLAWLLTEHVRLVLHHELGYRHFPATDKVSARNSRSTLTLHEPRSNNFYYSYGVGIAYAF